MRIHTPSRLPERIRNALIPVVPPSSSILIGLSGGIDSVVLLHLLRQIAPAFSWKLSAMHVHHGISPHADAWAQFCADLCSQNDISCRIERVDIAPLRRRGIEAAARELRHEALTRQTADFIALAHHRDDQVETLFLQLLRGAGVSGASAMPLLLPRAGKPSLLRPLLQVDRIELEVYAREHDLRWVEDESNADVSYPRNFLRHQVLPLLSQQFPAYRATLARSAGHFAEAADLLEELAMQDAQVAVAGHGLNIAALHKFSPARGRNLLRYFIQSEGAEVPDSSRLQEMHRQLLESRQDAQPVISWGGWQMRCFRRQAYVMPALSDSVAYSLRWQGESSLPLQCAAGEIRFERVTGQGLALQKLLQGVVTIAPRQGGEHIRLHALRPRQSLRNLLQQSDFPPWLRDRMPLVFAGDELVCIPGVTQSVDWAAKPGEEGVLVSWLPWSRIHTG